MYESEKSTCNYYTSVEQHCLLILLSTILAVMSLATLFSTNMLEYALIMVVHVYGTFTVFSPMIKYFDKELTWIIMFCLKMFLMLAVLPHSELKSHIKC